jgi:hypothetical protein
MNTVRTGGDTSRDRESFVEDRSASAPRPDDGREVIGPARDDLAATPTSSWDPYQVWLTRVKEPRERSTRSRAWDVHAPKAPPSPDTSDTARLRALAPIGPR